MPIAWEKQPQCPICGNTTKTSGCVVNGKTTICMKDGTGKKQKQGNGFLHITPRRVNRTTHGRTEIT